MMILMYYDVNLMKYQIKVLHLSFTEVVGPNKLDLKFISDVGQFEIGQVGGLAVNDAGELHIFHRGSRVWNSL